jgi:hypothetical protein
MGYTHYWKQSKPFTAGEWQRIAGEARRIVAKAANGLYAGPEDFKSQTGLELDHNGVREGFNEAGAHRIFPHPERPIPIQGEVIRVAGPDGTGTPIINDEEILLNGVTPDDYETFHLRRVPQIDRGQKTSFEFTKTEYRPYDAVVVSILAAARQIAPGKITVTSDGGPNVIKYVF